MAMVETYGHAKSAVAALWGPHRTGGLGPEIVDVS